MDWTGYHPRALDPGDALEGIGELSLFLGGSHDSFTAHLLKLFEKAWATPENLGPLALAFPRQYEAWRAWRSPHWTATPTAADLVAWLSTQPHHHEHFDVWRALAERV